MFFYSSWFETKFNSVPFQINWKLVNTIRLWFYFLCEIHIENQIFLESNLNCNYTFPELFIHQTKFCFVHKSIKEKLNYNQNFWFNLTRFWKYFSSSDAFLSCRQRVASNSLLQSFHRKIVITIQFWLRLTSKRKKNYMKHPKVKISHQISKRYWNILLKVRRLFTKSKFSLINKVEKRFFCVKTQHSISVLDTADCLKI